MCSHCLFAIHYSYSSCHRFGRIINRTQMAINFMWLHLVSHQFKCWLYGRIMKEIWCQSLLENATAHLSRWLNSIKEMGRKRHAGKKIEDSTSPSEEKYVIRDVNYDICLSTTPLKKLLGLVQWRIKWFSGPQSLNKIPRYVSLTITVFKGLILVRKSWL